MFMATAFANAGNWVQRSSKTCVSHSEFQMTDPTPLGENSPHRFSPSNNGEVPWFPVAPIAQLAEAADLKSVQCRFESDWGHN